MTLSRSSACLTIPGSGLLRSHGVEIREHGLDCPALALRTPRMRFLVLGDVLIVLEAHSALLAVVLVGRHRRLLQARTLFVGGPHTRHTRQAGLDCMPAGTRERAGFWIANTLIFIGNTPHSTGFDLSGLRDMSTMSRTVAPPYRERGSFSIPIIVQRGR